MNGRTEDRRDPSLSFRMDWERFKGALQPLIIRYGSICFAHVHERVLTKGFVVLMIENAKSNHLGAQGTFTMHRL